MVKIYLDGAGLDTMAHYAHDPIVEGFTTNPSLMRKAHIQNYSEFAEAVLGIVSPKPVSFEVLADDFDEMARQAHVISGWGENVWVKIPITNTKGESSIDLIDELQDLRLNITAVMTYAQVDDLAQVTRSHHIISVFAGRIADTGVDPIDIVKAAKARCRGQILWASPRQVFDIVCANRAMADIITLQPELIGKMRLFEKDLTQYSLETVKQFHEDGKGITF
jgi:transaldolase